MSNRVEVVLGPFVRLTFELERYVTLGVGVDAHGYWGIGVLIVVVPSVNGFFSRGSVNAIDIFRNEPNLLAD
jgi:hypothetical protein